MEKHIEIEFKYGTVKENFIVYVEQVEDKFRTVVEWVGRDMFRDVDVFSYESTAKTKGLCMIKELQDAIPRKEDNL